METSHWHDFLKKWSQEWLEDDEIAIEDVPPDVIASGWLGYPGATEAEIAQAERRLGATLPPSYREFLKTSNGWRWINFVERLWSTEEIEWLSARRASFVKGWTDYPVPDDLYFVYGDEQNIGDFRAQYLQSVLEVSDLNNGSIYLEGVS